MISPLPSKDAGNSVIQQSPIDLTKVVKVSDQKLTREEMLKLKDSRRSPSPQSVILDEYKSSVVANSKTSSGKKPNLRPQTSKGFEYTFANT
jgi:hypothetical protein